MADDDDPDDLDAEEDIMDPEPEESGASRRGSNAQRRPARAAEERRHDRHWLRPAMRMTRGSHCMGNRCVTSLARAPPSGVELPQNPLDSPSGVLHAYCFPGMGGLMEPLGGSSARAVASKVTLPAQGAAETEPPRDPGISKE